jgi:hypothetical protein
MPRSILKRCHHRLTAAALFVALLQAMIPAGFMPASDGSFSLQVCHSGMPDGHPLGHSRVDCPFGAIPGAGPILEIARLDPSWSVASQATALPEARRPFIRPERAHPSRGPPGSA